jgi:hypothetical protein
MTINNSKMAKTMNSFTRYNTIHRNINKSKNVKSESNSFFNHNGFKLERFNNINNQNNSNN